MTLRRALARAVHLGLEDRKVGEYDLVLIPKIKPRMYPAQHPGKTFMGGPQYAYG